MQKLLQSLKDYVPEGWQNRILVRRRAHLLREAGIVFIHIPKAAGSSVNQALYGRFMGLYSAQDFLG
jgi:chondroitin 4-sulfotransferase 11